MNLLKIFKRKDPFEGIPERRILNDEEAEFLADYFHNYEACPDPDGYVGSSYSLPKEVMKVYRRKYGESRKWGCLLDEE